MLGGLVGLIVLLLVIVPIVSRVSNKGSAVLVLKEFKLNENEDEFLIIKGRTAGFIGWFLSVIGINPVTSLVCNKKSIKFESSSVSGKTTTNVPLFSISGVTSGIKKPIGLIVFGILIIIGGIIGASISHIPVLTVVGIIIGIIFIVTYFLNKTMQFWIHYSGKDSPTISINVKESIIEGQNIDINQYESAANALKNAIIRIN
jgi:hypothetical protein